MSNELTDVRCPCGAEFQADSYDAGFIAGSGMCQNCDAALPPKDICTCPSGDGSLRHPCPAHIGPFDKLVGSPVHNESEPDLPPLDEHLAQVFETGMALSESVEQAGGDERVKCAVCVDSGKVYDISGEGPWKCYACTGSHEVIGYANGDELDNMLDDRTAVLSPVKTSFHTVPVYREARAALAQPSDEVVVTKNESGAIVSVTRQDKEGRVLSVIAESQPSPAQAEQAEAERPEVVAVMESNGAGGKRLAQRFPIVNVFVGDELMTVAQHERIVKAWIERWKAYIELSAKIAAQRDAANARLHEVATACATAEQERDAALAEVERLRESKGDPSGSFDRCMKMMYERDENAKRLDAALARVAELERQEPVALANRGLHAFWVKWTEAAAGLYGPGIKLYAAPVVQAQHSVPEVSGIGRDFAYPRSVVLYLRTEPTDDDLRAIHDGLRSLAAAPGKEGL